MAKSGMSPKTLQYLMGHSDIGVTLNTYAHLGLKDATDERIGECQKGTGKEQGGEARFAENVLGDLIYGEFVCPAWAGQFFYYIFPIPQWVDLY